MPLPPPPPLPPLPPHLERRAALAAERLALHKRSCAEEGWLPAREVIKRHPWLAGLTKLDAALAGLDSQARELGLDRNGGSGGGGREL